MCSGRNYNGLCVVRVAGNDVYLIAVTCTLANYLWICRAKELDYWELWRLRSRCAKQKLLCFEFNAYYGAFCDLRCIIYHEGIRVFCVKL